MKISTFLLFIFLTFSSNICAQNNTDIERAAQDYIDGFYEGDTTKIKRSVHPDLSKLGYSFREEGIKEHIMTYERAVGFARDVANDPQYAAPKDAVQKIEILDVQDTIASVKLTLYWGIDYLLLAKIDDKWMITKVLWQAVD